MGQLTVAIVGATGVVGESLRLILEERDFPVGKLVLLSSSRSAGLTLPFNDTPVVVRDLEQFDFSEVDIAFFSAGAQVSAAHAPRAAAAGALVIDNTSHFRMEPGVPLVVPEVNAHAVADRPLGNIIANPNCATIQLLVALYPLHQVATVRRLVVATYQSVSGSGRRAIDELASQSKALLSGREPESPQIYPQLIAFNALPHIDAVMDNGYTKEEWKMVQETQKIFEDTDVSVNVTAVRVPVFYGHAEAVHVTLAQPMTVSEARQLLVRAPGVEVVDGDETPTYPTPLTHAAGNDPVYVGRIRQDLSCERSLNLWVVADNVRKGAALNAVQIAEQVLSWL